MKLPGAEHAYIPPAKLENYLLSLIHPLGKSKAKLLRAAGFDSKSANVLARHLLTIASSEEVQESVLTPYGMKYLVDGSIRTPLGKSLLLRTVWIVERGETKPRFVTAYPL
ncbi:MAG: hypothetical protein M3498_14160 [Deinococcota bacterium]|nr:hypothetical protein [Deinococcota bacterium]